MALATIHTMYCCSAVSDLIHAVSKVKTLFPDSVIFVGGDFNKKDVALFNSAFPELLPIKTGATRRGVDLDEVYTNVTGKITKQGIQRPLEKDNGVPSDHKVITLSVKLPRHQKSVATKFEFTRLTTDGMNKLEQLLKDYDWEQIRKPTSSESAAAFDLVLQLFVVECFPSKMRSVRSTDAPLFDKKTKKCVQRKQKIYKAEGKSARYYIARDECAEAVLKAKKAFMDKVIKKTKETRNTGCYYRSVKLLKSKEAPIPWDVRILFPGLSDLEILVKPTASVDADILVPKPSSQYFLSFEPI